MSNFLQPSQLHEYQREAIRHQHVHPQSMLWLQMGLGKTIITLTTIVEKMRAGQIQKVLIFGPLRVIQAVWEREARKWDHTRHLRFSVVHGQKTKRLRSLFADADIFLTNYENMNWLAQELDRYFLIPGNPLPFQFVVYDEISKVKNSTTLRMKGGKRARKDEHGQKHWIKKIGWSKIAPHFQYRTGLTGTPASNGYLDLHGQFLVIDDGDRLGKNVTDFKDSYFIKGWNGWNYEPSEIGQQMIEQLISDITIKMDSADYLDMPKVKVTNMMVDLPANVRVQYEELEKEMFTELDSGTEVEVFNKASVSNKCLQFCNGSPYINNRADWEALHDVKLDALDDIIEEASGAPVLCAYSFKSDAERIMQKFKGLKPVNLTNVTSASLEGVIDRFGEGKTRLMIGHPKSMGHGIDGLQKACNILAWYGMNWSLELYDQFNARIIGGQRMTRPVSIIRILCRDTVDLAVADAIERKTDDQEGLKRALQRYRKGITTNNLDINFY